jgi:demethylmenaquinone methyltransferase/2-methoxy-6-polyprenyl-1,4-benzoquinol methylase
MRAQTDENNAEGTALEPAGVRRMFSRIAPRYDLLNHLLSFQMDRWWRRRTARRFGGVLGRPGARVLDLCCGTGDMVAALRRRAVASARIYGVDFSRPMLERAAGKLGAADSARLLAEADALRLPFSDSGFDLVTTAFGFRNLADYRGALTEVYRVLAPGGEVGILEFSEARSRLFGPLYGFYLRRLLPWIGGCISGDRAAYRYLQTSVAAFPSPLQLAGWMGEAGFADVRVQELSGGIACLHTARKS